MRVAYFGSDRFSRICLERLLWHNQGKPVFFQEHLQVFCPPESKGELLTLARALNIRHELLPPKTLRTWSIDNSFDIGLTASIGYFIPRRIIEAFPYCILNAHPSLLPKYRGASPIQYTIMNGDSVTGVSIIDLDTKEFDAGNIWTQEMIEIEPYTDFRSLEKTLALCAGDLFHQILQDVPTFSSSRRPQTGKINMAPKIEKSLARVDFSQHTALEIYGKYQALHHRERIHTNLVRGDEVMLIECLDPRVRRIKMSPAQFAPHDQETPAGGCFFERASGAVWVKAADGQWLGVTKFRVSGQSPTYDAGNFNRFAHLTQFKEKHFV